MRGVIFIRQSATSCQNRCQSPAFLRFESLLSLIDVLGFILPRRGETLIYALCVSDAAALSDDPMTSVVSRGPVKLHSQEVTDNCRSFDFVLL